jgi:GAF domain-containing protein
MLDEAARQRALDTYHVLDSLPEEAYDDVVRLASVVCGVPTALVSLVDRDRQWLKARIGFELSQTPRDVAFCDHAIRTPDRLLEVPDASRDPRFAANPLVTAEGGVRFYAGVPLVTPSGAAIGTVCVIDQQPRELDERQREALASLARLTLNLLEQRHRERGLERQLAFARMEAAEAKVAAAPSPANGPAPAVAPAESLPAVFLRADEALSAAKDAQAGRQRAEAPT